MEEGAQTPIAKRGREDQPDAQEVEESAVVADPLAQTPIQPVRGISNLPDPGNKPARQKKNAQTALGGQTCKANCLLNIPEAALQVSSEFGSVPRQRDVAPCWRWSYT